ncbi:hypothetical protein PMAC_000420 [Pneumocystis sp. 'macacae']|nr:hypothetical protein PMAC_000420 [Pneumocystis sp. 'macacae']
MRSEWDCIIVGAGILGAPLATVFGQRDTSEPDRIVGELLQPGGVAALHALGLEDTLEEIDAVRVEGYHLIWAEQQVRVPYEPRGAALGGRSFHHGRFVQRLRQKAQAQHCVQLLEATAVEIIENKTTGRVLGVTVRVKATGQLEQHFAPLIVVADGCFSAFRKQFISKPVIIKSNFIGLLLKNVILPMPLHGHVILSRHSPILIYQLSTHYTRILIDIPGKLPSNSTGELKKYMEEVVIPILPKSIQIPFAEALESQRIRSMPNCFLPPSLNKKPGLIVLGDAMNMRHPLTGGGMTVALNDVLLLSSLLSPTVVPSFQDINLVLQQMYLFHWKRKRLSSVINILAQSLYFLFSPTDTYLSILQKGCFQYFKLGGTAINGPIGLLSGIYQQPSLLFYHFFAVVFYSIYLALSSSFLNILVVPIVFLRACGVIFPYIWSWHDGFLHFHRFNFRAMLYDEENALVDDLFMPKQSVVSGDQIEFDHHLVSVEDALGTTYTDISSLYKRNHNIIKTEKNTIVPQKPSYIRKSLKQQPKQSLPKQLAFFKKKSEKTNAFLSTINITHNQDTPIQTKLTIQKNLPLQTIAEKKEKDPAIKINSIKKQSLEQDIKQEINTKDINEIFISDDEAYDLFSQ